MRIRLFLLLILFVSNFALAFGPKGHRICATLAEHYLSAEAREAIEAILLDEGLAQASTWADTMRSDSSDFWQNQAGYFHYVTVPDGQRYFEVGPPKHGDALTALAEFKKILKDPSSDLQARQLALRFTIHIIADIHQPLHVGNGKDKGGNLFKLKFFNKKTNLHAVWDSGLIKTQGKNEADWVAMLKEAISDEDKDGWYTTDPLDWVQESLELRGTIYPERRSAARRYLKKQLPVLKTRMRQAGYRTALYLNSLFSESAFKK